MQKWHKDLLKEAGLPEEATALIGKRVEYVIPSPPPPMFLPPPGPETRVISGFAFAGGPEPPLSFDVHTTWKMTLFLFLEGETEVSLPIPCLAFKRTGDSWPGVWSLVEYEHDREAEQHVIISRVIRDIRFP